MDFTMVMSRGCEGLFFGHKNNFQEVFMKLVNSQITINWLQAQLKRPILIRNRTNGIMNYTETSVSHVGKITDMHER